MAGDSAESARQSDAGTRVRGDSNGAAAGPAQPELAESEARDRLSRGLRNLAFEVEQQDRRSAEALRELGERIDALAADAPTGDPEADARIQERFDAIDARLDKLQKEL